jgi:Family of unknown function (DUF6113)
MTSVPLRPEPVITACAYVMLFVLGVVEGVFGSFQYSRAAPVLAICLAAGIFATCVAAVWGMQSATGALVPGAGWILASFFLGRHVPEGSVIIANTSAGQWYLYGGTAGVVLAMLASFVVVTQRRISK